MSLELAAPEGTSRRERGVRVERRDTLHLLPQWASLNKVVLDLLEQYQPAMAVKRLGTGLDLDPGLPLSWADRAQLEFGVGRMLRHAVKQSRRGGLILCRTGMDGEWLTLTIGNDGPSMRVEDAEAMLHRDDVALTDRGLEADLASAHAIAASILDRSRRKRAVKTSSNRLASQRARSRSASKVAAIASSRAASRSLVAVPVATSTSRPTRSGWRRARRCATKPPIEWPSTVARSIPAPRSSAAQSSAIASTAHGASCGRVRPTPRLSGMSVRNRDASGVATGSHESESDARPATSRSGGPAPRSS